MGQIMRYIDSLLFGIKYMNKPDVKYYRYMVHEDTDATMLRLFVRKNISNFFLFNYN
jgi:hypothetical protein